MSLKSATQTCLIPTKHKAEAANASYRKDTLKIIFVEDRKEKKQRMNTY